MVKMFYLILGGGLGTISRYFLAGFAGKLFGANFPYGTFIVNIIGCLIVGFLAGVSDKRFLLSEEMRMFLVVGFCGAFTTFSAIMLDTDQLYQNREIIKAGLYVSLSVFVGYVLFRFGYLLAELV